MRDLVKYGMYMLIGLLSAVVLATICCVFGSGKEQLVIDSLKQNFFDYTLISSLIAIPIVIVVIICEYVSDNY